MDERVFVSIKGLHFASGVQDSDSDGSEDEEVIETVNTGRYKRSGENEYIKYSDMIDGEDYCIYNCFTSLTFFNIE